MQKNAKIRRADTEAAESCIRFSKKIIQEVGYMAQKMYNGNETGLSEIKCLQNL